MIRNFVIAIALVIFSAPAFADSPPVETLSVQDAYAYATTSVQKNGAVFMTISNYSGDDARVTEVKAAVSEGVELHTHVMDGGIMMMREVEFYDVPAGGKTQLKPMGHHIMLMGLHAPLQAGETFPMTLTFESGASLDIDVAIKNPGDVE